MKIKITTLLFIILLSVTAFAQEDTYIVRFNDSMQLFSAKDNDGIDFIVATQEELQEYIEAGIVEHYEPNYEVCAIEPVVEEIEESVSDVVANWNFDKINAAFAYKTGAQGNDVKIAVIDSGLNSDYKIRSQILNGYDYINNEATDATVKNDGSYHGTIVSSIIVRHNNDYGTGVASRASIVPLRVLDDNNSGNVADVIRAIEDATDKYNCDVINLSLVLSDNEVTESNLTTLKTTIKKAVDKGIIVVAAAGNKKSSDYAYPASIDDVISVASVESDGTHSEFSQFNEKVDISAPGGLMQIDIMYKLDENGEERFSLAKTSGTSFAAPHVSGLAAIAKCISPQINQKEFMRLLEETSDDLGATGKDIHYGYGLINCESAIKKLIEGRKLYISPVSIRDVNEANYTGKVSEVIIYNNTGKSLDFEMIYALYNADRTLSTVKKGQGTLAGDSSGPWQVKYSSGNVRYMVWESLKNMVPLGQSSYK